MDIPIFSDENLKLIVCALPAPPSNHRAKLFADVLHDWRDTELCEYFLMEPAPVARQRLKRMEALATQADRLVVSFNGIDDFGRFMIKRHMMAVDGRKFDHSLLPEYTSLLNDQIKFVAELSTMEPKNIRKKTGRGRPPNIPAYLVLLDAVQIFEWYTGLKATREIDRSSGNDTGTFWEFTSTLWPIVFGSIEGLSNTRKNWEKFGEVSALIANINLRHPSWGVFKK